MFSESQLAIMLHNNDRTWHVYTVLYALPTRIISV